MVRQRLRRIDEEVEEEVFQGGAIAFKLRFVSSAKLERECGMPMIELLLRAVARAPRRQSRVDLVWVLQHAMRGAEPSFNDRGALLDPLIQTAPVELDADASALEQLFLNVLFNAAQALGPDGRARIDVATVDGSAIVKVVDLGVGIAASELSADGVPIRSTTPDGTGLGLPIARRIAVAHGGDLCVESTLGAGTTVTVRLPRHTAEPVALATPAERPVLSVAKESL